jgi:secretion/DNA translocation related TadE-like protein
VSRSAHREESGATTVFALAVVATLLVLTVGCCVAGSAVVTHRRAQAAADLAALAAAQALQDTGAGCAAAAATAVANGARLEDCRVVGLDAVVTVRAEGPALLGAVALRARARAGPDAGDGRPDAGSALQQQVEQRDRARLVERTVLVAALR